MGLMVNAQTAHSFCFFNLLKFIWRYTMALICFLLLWYLTESFKDISNGRDGTSEGVLRKSTCVQGNYRELRARA